MTGLPRLKFGNESLRYFTENAVNGLAHTAVRKLTAKALNTLILEKHEVTKHKRTYGFLPDTNEHTTAIPPPRTARYTLGL